MRFLILLLDGDGYAVPNEGLLEITKEPFGISVDRIVR